MQISQTMAEKLNVQVREEFFSYWTYLAMSYRLSNLGFRGFAKWYEAQAAEEMVHAIKIANYLVEVGAEVKLGQLDVPKSDYKTVKEVVQKGLDHEKYITDCINRLVDAANKENDYATSNFLAWFVDEQVEEVSTAQKLLDMVSVADDKIHLLLLESRIFDLREQS